MGFYLSDRPIVAAAETPHSAAEQAVFDALEASRASVQERGSGMRDRCLQLIRSLQLKKSLWTTRERGLFLRQLGMMYLHGITLSSALHPRDRLDPRGRSGPGPAQRSGRAHRLRQP